MQHYLLTKDQRQVKVMRYVFCQCECRWVWGRVCRIHSANSSQNIANGWKACPKPQWLASMTFDGGKNDGWFGRRGVLYVIAK